MKRLMVLLAIYVAVTVALVLPRAAEASPPDPHKAKQVSRRVFGRRWRMAYCEARAESRFELTARNGVNRGPWQISVTAHPWVDARRLTSSWLYSARVAYRISDGGRDWNAWSTAEMCAV